MKIDDEWRALESVSESIISNQTINIFFFQILLDIRALFFRNNLQGIYSKGKANSKNTIDFSINRERKMVVIFLEGKIGLLEKKLMDNDDDFDF